MKALIDGDILAYRIGFTTEDVGEPIVRARVDEFLSELLMDLDVKDYDGWLSGDNNFRDKIAVTVPYKGNRTGRRPIHYQYIRDYLVNDWGFKITEGQEADDALAIQATELRDKCIICSIDKDLLQVPGWHYNFVKKEKTYVDESTGTRNFYQQVLTGDRVDNIVGIRGIGPVKASAILKCCRTDEEYFRVCVESYDGNVERVVENCRLLWLRRYPDQTWERPLSENIVSKS